MDWVFLILAVVVLIKVARTAWSLIKSDPIDIEALMTTGGWIIATLCQLVVALHFVVAAIT